MRNRLLAAASVLVLSMVQLACGGDASAPDGLGETIEATAAVPGQPSKDLANAPVTVGASSDKNDVKSGASTAFGAADTNIAVGGSTPPGGSGDPGSDPVDPGGDPVDPGPGPGPGPSNPGPKPPTCSVSKDGAGFFVRTTSKSNYTAYVPASYNGSAPMRLIVGMHGCGDSAANFAGWAINPYSTRATQQHIGISIGGQDGNCWSTADDDKVLAAIDDIASCFWVHQKKVSLAGFSSGGRVAYRLGLKYASRFAAILIENSAMPSDGDALLANASRKINIAHRHHTGDTVFPITPARLEWQKIRAAGFPLLTSETGGGHDGVGEDWSNWLIPQSASWTAP